MCWLSLLILVRWIRKQIHHTRSEPVVLTVEPHSFALTTADLSLCPHQCPISPSLLRQSFSSSSFSAGFVPTSWSDLGTAGISSWISKGTKPGLPLEANYPEDMLLHFHCSESLVLISFNLHSLKMQTWGTDTDFGELIGIHTADAERSQWPPCLSEDAGLGATKRRAKRPLPKRE